MKLKNYVKIFMCVLMSFLWLCPAVASSSSKKTQPTEITATGFVQVFGNEPHTWLGLVTDDGKQYTLLGSKNTISALHEMQGLRLTVTGQFSAKNNADYQVLRDGEIAVKKISQSD